MKTQFVALLTALVLAGCLNPQDVHDSVDGEDRSKLSVGAVQRSVKVGMTDAQVAESLGSPNIISTDEEGRNVWIYDRVRTSVRATTAQRARWQAAADRAKVTLSAWLRAVADRAAGR
jgi:outer membrane protein assembly factor BamE (lipoprotein component of BamABCDE complex)